MAATTLTPTRRSTAAAAPLKKTVRILKYVVFYGCLSLIALVFLAPYVIAFFGAFKSEANLFSTAPWAPPHSFYTGNFKTILFSDDFIRYLGNTLLITCALTAGQVTFGVLSAYAFARLEFPGRDALFAVYLATLMVPNVVTLVPLYTMMRQFHLTNTYWAIFLPYVLGVPYTIFLMRQYFRSLPSDVFAAARVDGCSEWRILTRILIPMARPIIVTATLIAFVFGWNNFLWPLIVTNSTNKYVLTIAIAEVAGGYGTRWDVVLTGGMIALIPLLILFAVFQRQIIRSVQLTGSVK